MRVGRLPARTLLTVGATLVSAGISCWLAARLYRQRRDAQTPAYGDLARPYLWFRVVFGLGILGVGVTQTTVGQESI
jgi:hypothetical protein